MLPVTRFTDAAAVDAWDDGFRWRTAEGLRDRTIDSTWWRVAGALAAADGPLASAWAARYVDVFSHWQLLPDERLLRMAGTGVQLGRFDSPAAALNVGAFVLMPLTRQARFDAERFSRVAALAVRLLDDALVVMHAGPPAASGLRIGLMGFADALDLLGIRYDEARAADQASAVGKALAIGTLRGATELADERGPADADPAFVARCRDRDAPVDLVEAVLRRGVRHTRLTAIERQPHLALLANNASDALDPRLSHPRPALDRTSTKQPVGRPRMSAEAMVTAQLAIRAAMQPWIDAPIDYPLARAAEPANRNQHRPR